MAVSLRDIGIVLDLARVVQQLGENWYRASTALEEFKTNVADFFRRYEAWQKRAEDYGLSSELTLRVHLDDAKSKLEEEKSRLKNLQKGIGGRCWFKIRGTAFPFQMGQSLKTLLSLDERILGDWTADEVADARARKTVVKLAKETFIFRRDDRYVRLPDIERQIKEALENCGAANKAVRVILCHGPAGIGKSCMARNLAMDYEEEAATAKTSVVECSTAAHLDGAFEQVIYLECGDEVDFKAKKIELLKVLGWGESLESEETSREETPRAGEAKSSNSILKQLLKERRILIILDDVWSRTFLEEMNVLCGKHIRILVTSQRSYLCENSSIRGYLSIPMDNIANKDAKQILKVHAGFAPEDIVPGPIQECMDELIKKLSTNPHALASVATAVDCRRPTRISEWQDAIREYDFVLAASNEMTESSKTRMKFQGITYSPSIALKFQRLDEQERNLMILMAMLEGPLVPELLIQLFYMTILLQNKLGSHRSCTSFSRCRRQLEDFQCVKITGRHESFWSIHYLDKLFVETTMIEDVESMFEKFQNLSRRIQGLESKPQEDLVRLLGALYFKDQWAKQTVTDGSLDVKVTKLDAATRNAIQPIVSLIVENVGDDWSKREQLSADQIFLSYICDATIHAKAAKILLSSPKSKNIFCSVILNISKVSDIDLTEKVILALLDAVGDSKSLKNSSGELELNMSQCEYLLFLAQGAADPNASNFVRYSICRVSMILSGLTQIITSRPDQPTLQLLSVKILSWLAARDCLGQDTEDYVLLLVNTPMLVEGLVRTMEKDELDSLSQNAACTLWCLVLYCDVRHTDLVHPIIIDIGFQSLIDSLAKKGNPVLQRYAAYVLVNIAWPDSQISLKILKCPNVLTYLVDILDSGNGPYLDRAASHLMRTIVCNSSIAPSETLSKSTFSKVNICLAQLLRRAPQISEEVESNAAVTLTWIDPMKGRSVVLSSASAHRERGVTLVQLGHYRDGLTDLEKAREIEAGKNWDTFRCLITARAKLGDLEGALKDANRALKLAGASMPERRFVIRDRGVVKRLMGDLPGALEDFDEILKIYPNVYLTLKQRAYVKFVMGDEEGARTDGEKEYFDEILKIYPSVYPTLKQRAYVKFMMGDEEGARTDGEKARQVHTKIYDLPQLKKKRLVYSPVEFLNFQL